MFESNENVEVADSEGRAPKVPAEVTRGQVTEALKPLCDLLGITVYDFFESPGITVGDRVVTFTLATRKAPKGSDVVVDQAQIGGVVIVGTPPTHEPGIPVTVAVR